MKNGTYISVPKKYHKMIKEIYKDQDGYWVCLAAGYYASGTDGYDAAHVIHEDYTKDVLKQIRLIRAV